MSRGQRIGITLSCSLLGLSVRAALAAISINVDDTQHFQQMAGFGASLTDSGANAIANPLYSKLTAAQRDALMTSLFSPTNGIGLSFLRQPMGASDFRVADYTYDDTPGDFSLSNFSVAHDDAYIIPLLQQARTLNPALQIMASPWSAPGWLKTGTPANVQAQSGVDPTLYGGTLGADPQTYDTYARYFVKFVQAYALRGLTIDAITPQNEPLYATATYPTMYLSAAQEDALVKAIGKAFADNHINTRIVIFDHNWDLAVKNNAQYISAILNDPQAAPLVDGIAFHGYGGSVTAQNTIHNLFPTKQIYFTEQTGSVGSNFAGDLMYDMKNLIVGGTRDWASSIVKFNLALDQTNGPKIEQVTVGSQSENSGCDTCRGVVTINNQTGAVTYNEEYYALGQASKFVAPGAYRIFSDLDHSAAFLNPDKTIALIVYNDSTSASQYQVKWSGAHFNYTLPPQSVVTFDWSTLQPHPTVEVYLTTGDRSRLLSHQPSLSFVPEPDLAALLVPCTLGLRRRRRLPFRTPTR